MKTKFIPYGKQDITDEDIAAVVKVLKSDWLTQGPNIIDFEKALASYCGAKHAVALSNGTAALHIACMALGVGPGDSVWTVPNTFVASANCARYCGADVDFVDIDARTYNISVAALKIKLAAAEKAGTLPKVIIPVYFAGQPCDMQSIKQLADQYGFKILADACHAIGGRYQDKPIGDCRYADMTVFSFHPVKIITTGEGGVITTNNSEYAQKLQLFRTHGVTRDVNLMQAKPEGPWCYEQIDLGYNYRITDLQCALGSSQLKRLDQYVVKRHALVGEYNKLLADLPLVLPYQAEQTYSAFHLYVVRLQLDKTQKTRLEVFNALRAANIGVNVHYIPVHTQPYYQKLGFNWGQFPEAEQYYREAISLPLFPGMDQSMLEYVVAQLEANLSLKG
ncbi:MAG: UDP-4-amino-4,6-dideoxy-N-acetyl-beta-L-altrosamine transaminase [Gammaproteobacteria bacterium]|nr:UDP-4-amino-4,6-dideoxy-N-acetyl-beta-L-altrosamine transaminase [Gammaproteobacteria bacterium]